jgi:hypothetical protein
LSDLQQNSGISSDCFSQEAAVKREDDPVADDDRREFLKQAGRFAAATPPVVAFLLSTSMSSKAIAASAGKPAGRPGHGFGDGNHDHWGPPGQNKKL